MVDLLPPETALDLEPFDDDAFAIYIEYVAYVEREPDRLIDDRLAKGPVGQFRVDGPDLAEWAMAKYAAAQAEVAEVEAQALRHKARIDEWAEKATARAKQSMSFFEAHLVDYALHVRDDSGGKVKSLRVPSGRVATHESKPAVTVLDDEAVIGWARATLDEATVGEVLAVTTKVMLRGLRARVVVHDGAAVDSETGEVVPGVTVTEGRVTADVRPGE